MKALRLHAPGEIHLHDEPFPQAGPGEVLVRVKAVGICGSDLLWFQSGGIGDARLTRPLVPGHEFAGVIAAGPRRGVRVAVDPAIPCHTCSLCQQGHPNLCLHLRFAGDGNEDGALREYLAWPEECLFPLPDTLSEAEGALLEPLGVALHAVDLAHPFPGARVGVFGCGPIGLFLIQLMQQAGAEEILVSEPLPHRLEAARRWGARPWEDGQEVDVAFEAAGEDSAVTAAMTAVRPGGRVILIGIPANDRTTFPASLARRKGLTIKLVRRMKFTYPRALRLVESGRVDARALVSHRFPLDQAQTAFAVAQRREGLKVIIEL
jgi:L-iditol 2-dehydrogenase